MSYEKQTWNTGDIITAEKLNHMENGISESGSGSDLPAYTNSDAGKVLSLVKKEPVVQQFFPEQEVEAGQDAPLSNVTPPNILYIGMTGTLVASEGGQSVEVSMVYTWDDMGMFISTDQSIGVMVGYDEVSGQWVIAPGGITASMTVDVPSIDSYTEGLPSTPVTTSSSVGELTLSVPSWFTEGAILKVTFDGDEYMTSVEDSGGGLLQATLPMVGAGLFVNDGALALYVDEDGTYQIKIEVANPKVDVEWAFKQSGSAGITPRGEIQVAIAGRYSGSSVTIYGIFAKHSGTVPDTVEYEQGSHTFEYSPAVSIGEPTYTVAVPTVGEGDEEHIDCYIAFANYQMAGASTLVTTGDFSTFNRMKNTSNVNQNVWHCVSANGTLTGKITATFAEG